MGAHRIFIRRCGCFLTEPCPSVSPTIMRGFRRNKDLRHKLKGRAVWPDCSASLGYGPAHTIYTAKNLIILKSPLTWVHGNAFTQTIWGEFNSLRRSSASRSTREFGCTAPLQSNTTTPSANYPSSGERLMRTPSIQAIC